jgi:hypothetical protein
MYGYGAMQKAGGYGKQKDTTPTLPLLLDDSMNYANVAAAMDQSYFTANERIAFVDDPWLGAGTKVLRVEYTAELISYIQWDHAGYLPASDNGLSEIIIEWDELRDENFDYNAEKTMRPFGKVKTPPNDNNTMEYVLTWIAGQGPSQHGTDGIRDPLTESKWQVLGNSSPNGEDDTWTMGKAVVGGFTEFDTTAPSNEWHNFRYRVALGTIGVADGEFDLQIDDSWHSKYTNKLLRSAGADGHTIGYVRFGGWGGGSYPINAPVYRYMKNFKIWGS